MILAALAGVALVMSVATGPTVQRQAPVDLSVQQKNTAMQPLIRSATECIAQAVAANPRFARSAPSGLGELIVESVPSCLEPVRAMIDRYDRYFGEGSGEAFFMGPYLDVLPKAVSKAVSDPAQ
jgi:hypothetical protein